MLDNINMFVEVARTLSFRNAAEKLDISSSTLSRHILQLEKKIGLQLLLRSTLQVQLTSAGQMYFERCQRLIDEAREAHENLDSAAGEPTGTLRIAIPADLATNYLSRTVFEFSQQHPLINFEFDLAGRYSDLLSEKLDLVIRVDNIAEEPSSFIIRRIASIPMSLYASTDYLRQSKEIRHPSDLTEHVCIEMAVPRKRGQWILHHSSGSVVDIPAGQRFSVNSIGLAHALARFGAGIVPLSTKLVGTDIAAGRLHRVLKDWTLAPMNVYAIATTRLLPSRVRLFLDFIKTKFAES